MPDIGAIYIALDNAFDLHAWSGTPFFMRRALESAGFQLEVISPLNLKFRLFYKLKGKLIRLRGWDYNYLGETAVLKNYAWQVRRKISRMKGRVILSCGKPQLAYLQSDLPVLLFDDGSVPAITTLHPGHKNYFPPIQRNLLSLERTILQKCDYACYMSEWAAEAAVNYYGAEFRPKIKVVPIGPNMDDLPTQREIEQRIVVRESEICRLFFVGVSWRNKGADIAVSVAEELNRRGVSTRLDVVGCLPPGKIPDFVRIHGFVSKKDDEGRNLISRLYQRSHFFILPTRAEAYGIAFVEACANALPCLGSNVGGVSTIIQDGINGWLFARDASVGEYADRIQLAWKSRERYLELCRSTFQTTQSKLSWKQFGATVYDLVSQKLHLARGS